MSLFFLSFLEFRYVQLKENIREEIRGNQILRFQYFFCKFKEKESFSLFIVFLGDIGEGEAYIWRSFLFFYLSSVFGGVGYNVRCYLRDGSIVFKIQLFFLVRFGVQGILKGQFCFFRFVFVFLLGRIGLQEKFNCWELSCQNNVSCSKGVSVYNFRVYRFLVGVFSL